MPSADFQFLYDLLKRRSGLALTEDKSYLIESRLLPVARNHGCTSISTLVELVKSGHREEILNEITEAMMVNESLFFRDVRPFEYLRRTVLPAYKAMPERNSLRVWSAACSAGQEPYSIAMCLREEGVRVPGWRHEIVATDIAGKVLDKARDGIYSQFEIQRGLPIQMLVKYFHQVPGTTFWQAKNMLRNMVSYRIQNLLDNFSALGKFDIIFCRNVLIYFDEATRALVTLRLAGALNPGGYLFLGSTETIMDKSQFIAVADQCRGLYRLEGI